MSVLYPQILPFPSTSWTFPLNLCFLLAELTVPRGQEVQLGELRPGRGKLGLGVGQAWLPGLLPGISIPRQQWPSSAAEQGPLTWLYTPCEVQG